MVRASDESRESVAPSRGTTARRILPLRAAAITIYASFLLLALTIPGSIVGALRAAPRTFLTEALLVGAERVEAALDSLGVPAPYRIAKEYFREAACAGPETGNPC